MKQIKNAYKNKNEGDYVDLKNIKEGMIVKNYKEMCKLLGEKEKGGNSRAYQIKDWERYFKFKKDGHKFVIQKINSVVEEKIDNRKLNTNFYKNKTGAYGKYIRLLVLNMLSINKDNVIHIGKGNMLESLNLVNRNYRFGNYNRKALAKYLGMDLDFIHEFFNTNGKKLKASVERTMNNLMNKESLVMWGNIKMIRTEKDQFDRKATNEEVKIILNCGAEALRDMGVSDVSHIFIANRVREFYELINEKLSSHGILRAYDGYEIIFSDMVYEKNEQMSYKLELDELTFNRAELNGTVINKLGESARSRHNKVKKEADNLFFGVPDSEWLDQNNGYKRTVIREKFIDENKKIIDVCITSDAPHIVSGIKYTFANDNDTEQVHLEELTIEEK